jgi:hypothetical protein
MKHSSSYRIKMLQQRRLITAVESIAVLVFSLFVAIFLPQLLLRYLYADQQLLAEPVLLQYIPVVAFAIGVGFGLYALVANIMTMMKVRKLQAQLPEAGSMGGACGVDCACCSPDDEGYQEVKDLASAVAKSSGKKSSSSKSKKSKKKSDSQRSKKSKK